MAAQKHRYKTNLGKALAKLANNLRVVGDFVVADPSNGANPKYETFKNTGIRRQEGLANNSVSVTMDKNRGLAMAQIGRYNPYGSVFYSTLSDNKAGRIYEYRLMAGYSEVTNALEYACNEFITVDDDGNVAKLTYTKPSASPVEKTTLSEEFNYFVKLFKFEERGFDYCRRFLTEGEVFLELIINNNKPEYLKEGILGVQDISPELVDPVWKSKTAMILDGFLGRRPVYNQEHPEQPEKIELVPYETNQLFYVCSGDWDPEREFMVPFIERARRRYIQLSYIEDAIVIYRLVRAPERLVFTIPTGNLSPYDAERYIRNVMEQHWKTKVMDCNTLDITQKYNPQSMTDGYYFAKPMGGEAVSVTSLKGADNLGELNDLNFFLRALYRDLKIPSVFLNPESQKSADSSQILVEQLRFSKFINSVQQKFASALKQAFITHLKFKGLWEKYHVHENHLEIRFNEPDTYSLMRKLQVIQMRNDIFTSITGSEIVSKIYALKKFFDWSDKEVLANIAFLKTESDLLWEIEQHKQYGPTWKQSLVTQAGQAGGGGDLGMGGGPGGGGPGGLDLGGGGGMGGPPMDLGGGGPEGAPPPDAGGPPADAGPQSAEASLV